jgi:aspartyl-tRNA(Asn)/glutamyl-tRNA(Gln) amidotransferase subunit C
MAITRKEVLHIATLARLDLTEDEVTHLVRDLGSILEHVAELSQVDTSGVAGTAYLAVETAPLRRDEVQGSVDRESVLREAPRQGDGGFAVPAFVDEG